MHQQVRSDIRLKTWCIFMFSHDSSLVRSPSFEELILSSSKDFLVSGGEPGPLHITESAFIEHCCKQVNAGMAGFQNSLELQGRNLGCEHLQASTNLSNRQFPRPRFIRPVHFPLKVCSCEGPGLPVQTAESSLVSSERIAQNRIKNGLDGDLSSCSPRSGSRSMSKVSKGAPST